MSKRLVRWDQRLLLFLTFSALVANPKKNTLHGGRSRSWSAEQGVGGRGTGRPFPSREIKFSGANGDREKNIFPVQLTTSRTTLPG